MLAGLRATRLQGAGAGAPSRIDSATFSLTWGKATWGKARLGQSAPNDGFQPLQSQPEQQVRATARLAPSHEHGREDPGGIPGD